jgi:hypothetical protein
MMPRLIAVRRDLFSMGMPPERYRVRRDEVRPKQLRLAARNASHFDSTNIHARNFDR